MFSHVIPALVEFFQWPTPMFLMLGGILGIIFGILPGLGGAQVLALLLPVSFGLSETSAIALLIGAMGGIPTSGSITSILFNTPGTAQSAATCFDGFPLARQGKAGYAIGASISASLFGAIFGIVVLTALLPIGRQVVLSFSYPEYFMLAIMGMSVIAVISTGSVLKGLISAVFGLMLATIGYDPITGEVRYTFGWVYLYEGLKLTPVLIGLFAVSEAIDLLTKKEGIAESAAVQNAMKGTWEGIMAPFRHFGLFIRSSIVGTIIGIIPGVGGSVANFLAYGQAVQTAKDKSMFGKGDIRGVIAPEAANNAKDGGALVPTLIFGIPGSVEMAILLGALTIFNIQPGPRLILDRPEIAITMIYALLASNIIAAVVSLILVAPLARLTTIKGTTIAPAILMISLVGAYATDGLVQDVVIALVFGLLGYAMRRLGFSPVPLIISLVLGELIEINYHQTLLTMGAQSFVTRPISLVLFLITAAMIVIPTWKKLAKGDVKK